jgi:hypothetical protein
MGLWMGCHPDVTLVMRHAGSRVEALRATNTTARASRAGSRFHRKTNGAMRQPAEGGQRMGTTMQDALFERSTRHQNLKISQAARRTISCIPFSKLIRLSTREQIVFLLKQFNRVEFNERSGLRERE